MRNLIPLLALMLTSEFAFTKELYRAPSAGDKGTYYVLESKDSGNDIIHVLTSRVGKGNAYTDFTELKINCKSKQYYELAGGSENGAKEKPSKQLNDWSKSSKWTSLVPGSSKYDLVNFICTQYK